MLSNSIFNVYTVICYVMHNDVKIFNVISYAGQKQRLNEKSRDDLFTPCCGKGSTTVTWILAETHRQAGEWEALLGEQRKDFRCVLVRGCWLGVAGGRLTRSKVSDLIGEGCIFGFLWLSLSWKEGKNRESCQLLINLWPF